MYVCKLTGRMDEWRDATCFTRTKFPISLPSLPPLAEISGSTFLFFFSAFPGNVVLRSRHFCSSNLNAVTNVFAEPPEKRRERTFPKKWPTWQVRNFFRHCLSLVLFPIVAGIWNRRVHTPLYSTKKKNRGEKGERTRRLHWWWDRTN